MISGDCSHQNCPCSPYQSMQRKRSHGIDVIIVATLSYFITSVNEKKKILITNKERERERERERGREREKESERE